MRSCYLILSLILPALCFGQMGPTTAPAAPDQDAANVISLFSDAYDDVAVNTYLTDWSQAVLTDTVIDGNAVKRYSNLNFAGIETIGPNAIDLVAGGMTHLHVDFWSPNSTTFRIKLVDFGGDGFGNGNDTEFEMPMELAQGEWVSLDLALSDFTGMNQNDINQFIISSLPANGSDVYLDNIYFYNDGVTSAPQAPSVAAPTPILPAANVISLFSDTYDDVTVDTFITEWSQAILTDTTADGDAVKRYSNLNFAGIEMIGDNALDLTGAGMTHLHVDFWSPNSTTFRIKLVDFGGDGFGGDNDTEFEIPMDLLQGQWVSLDIPLSDFMGMNQTDINQFIISSAPAGSSTVFLDNIYFYEESNGPTGPMMAAAAPTQAQEDVISIFSDSYTDVDIDTFITVWSAATLTDTVIDNSNMKLYSDLNFAGMEMTGDNALDLTAAGMTHLRVDLWTPNSTTFRIKLVDFGGDGFGNGNDTEFEIAMDVAQSEWVSLDIPLSDFAGMNQSDISQFIISSAPAGSSRVYFDNIFFYRGETGSGDEPMTAAPTPTRAADKVISMFSDAYDDVTVDTWLTVWSSAGLEDIMVEGNPTKKYSNLVFAGIETTGENAINLEENNMTHLHVDFWTPDIDTFRIKLVDFAMDGFGNGNDTEFEYAIPTNKREWMSMDIPLTEFPNMNQSDINQFIISALPAGGTVYLDNVYYYDDLSATNDPVRTGLLKAFPNPTSDQLTISAPAQMELLTIYNLNGAKVVEYQPQSTQFNLSTNQLAKGMYIALATTTEGQMVVRFGKQ